jgi:predicted RNA-binding Zn-ribbon protein involved in translation (DUF1610 family)
MKDTHYCEPLAERNRYSSKTLCGRWVMPRHESQTPTCPICAEELARRLTDTRTAEDVFGSVMPALDFPTVDVDPTPDTDTGTLDFSDSFDGGGSGGGGGGSDF